MPFIKINTEGSPELDTFARHIAERLDAADPRRAFWQCSDAFEALMASDFLTGIGHAFMQTMLDTPTRSSGQWQVHQAVLLQQPSYALTVTWTLGDVPSDPTIASHAAHAMICTIGSRPILIDMYQMPPVDLNVFEKGALLAFSHQVILEPRQILELDGEQWVTDAHPCAGTCIVTFASAQLGTQIWSFDRATKESWAVSSASQESTQIKETLGILRRFKHADAAPTVERLCAHPNHDIRWEAIKTLGILDSARAIERLRQAASDAHPHVRASAARTLSKIDAS